MTATVLGIALGMLACYAAGCLLERLTWEAVARGGHFREFGRRRFLVYEDDGSHKVVASDAVFVTDIRWQNEDALVPESVRLSDGRVLRRWRNDPGGRGATPAATAESLYEMRKQAPPAAESRQPYRSVEDFGMGPIREIDPAEESRILAARAAGIDTGESALAGDYVTEAGLQGVRGQQLSLFFDRHLTEQQAKILRGLATKMVHFGGFLNRTVLGYIEVNDDTYELVHTLQEAGQSGVRLFTAEYDPEGTATYTIANPEYFPGSFRP